MSISETITSNVKFTDNPSATARPEAFTTVKVKVAPVLKSWKKSLFSFEWLDKDGGIKPPGDMKEASLNKRTAVEGAIEDGQPLPRPVLGLGIADNVEIGAGREVFLTLAAQGHETISVHIPLSCLEAFHKYLAE